MSTLSVRGMDPAVLAELERRASHENTSASALALRLIEQGLRQPTTQHQAPRTVLGARLLRLRQAHIASGGALLSGDELAQELRARRGGVDV
ncbi:MAG: hypothetical protein Q4G71_07180 [Pseudomonadota bacterium]|nr:hypothetical protein [Pseudomonadota bacterium]